ncbi:MAG: hypothetical protein GY826_36770, partial [Fuerstiella sp.]|nr:hypothetical protein [Fuerstiella sp.]
MSKNSPQPESIWSMQAVIDWLFGSGRLIDDSNRFTHELAQQLVSAGSPVDGIRLMVLTLNPQVLAFSNIWSSSDNRTQTTIARHGIRDTDQYIGSPLQIILEERRTLHQPLNELPENPHAAYLELLA